MDNPLVDGWLAYTVLLFLPSFFSLIFWVRAVMWVRKRSLCVGRWCYPIALAFSYAMAIYCVFQAIYVVFIGAGFVHFWAGF